MSDSGSVELKPPHTPKGSKKAAARRARSPGGIRRNSLSDDLIDRMISPVGGSKPKVAAGLKDIVDAYDLGYNSSGSLDVSASSIRLEFDKETVLAHRKGDVPKIVSKLDEQEEANAVLFKRVLLEKEARKNRCRKRPKKGRRKPKKQEERPRISSVTPSTAVWSTKWALPSLKVDHKTFIPPKNLENPTEEQSDLLQQVMTENVLFRDHQQAHPALVDAFETVNLRKGRSLDSNRTDEFFYVVEEGEVDIVRDGALVAQAKGGETFGDLNLLYDQHGTGTPNDSHSVITPKKGAKLLRLNQKDYRSIIQAQAKQDEADKQELLKQVPFLMKFLFSKEVDKVKKRGSKEDLEKVTSIMEPIRFSKGDDLSGKEGDKKLYFIKDGNVKIESDKKQQFVLGPGSHIGREAVTGSRGKEPVVAKMEALTDGTAYAIEKSVAEKVLGSDFVATKTSRLDDKGKLASFECIKSVNMDAKTLQTLADTVTDKQFTKGTKVLQQGAQVEPCLYLVRHGSVTLSSDDGKFQQVVGPGGYFGVEKLLVPKGKGSKDPSSLKSLTLPAKWNVTVSGNTPCVMGVLSLIDSQEIMDNGGKPKEERKVDVDSPVAKELEATMKIVKADITLDDLDMLSILGDGAFGEVWKVSADLQGETKEFALKKVAKEPDVLDAIEREIEFLETIVHPFIVNLVTTFDTEDSMYMMMGLIPGGELWEVIHREDGDGNWSSGVPEAQAKFYALMVADVLAHIHSKGYIYRDLKPENVMIDSDGYPVLVDFGFAKLCSERTFTSCGTPNYVAPEIITNEGHNKAVDYWALGVLVYEMVSGEHPFFVDGMDQIAVFECITLEEHPPISKTSKAVTALIDGLLEKTPSQRLGMLAGGANGILKHQWFNDLNLEDMLAKKMKAPWIPRAC